MSALDLARLVVAALALTAGALAAVSAQRGHARRSRLVWASASAGFFYGALTMTVAVLR